MRRSFGVACAIVLAVVGAVAAGHGGKMEPVRVVTGEPGAISHQVTEYSLAPIGKLNRDRLRLYVFHETSTVFDLVELNSRCMTLRRQGLC